MKNILVSQSFNFIKKRDETRDFIDSRLIEFLNKCKLNSTLVPNNLKNLKYLLKKNTFDGIVLSGGNDIYFKGMAFNKSSKKINLLTKKRNSIEKKLIIYSIQNKIPVIGICRGFQFLNLFYGGKIKKIKGHVRKKHLLKIEKKENLNKFTRFINKKVNSFHNFGIISKNIAKKFQVLAKTKDSIEAAINLNNRHLGIMWHPEREKKFSKKDILLFKKIFNA